MTKVDTSELVYHTTGAGPCPQPGGQPCEEGTEPGPEVVVVGKSPPPAADVGTPIIIGGGTSTPPTFKVSGRTWCQPAKSGFDDAMSKLYEGSATARQVIDQAHSNNAAFNVIRIDKADGGDRDMFDQDKNAVSWDPFSYPSWDENGVTKSAPPVLALAHEICHAASPASSEAAIIDQANKIANEYNRYFGTTFEANRSVHGSGDYKNTDSITSTTFSISRGDQSCN